MPPKLSEEQLVAKIDDIVHRYYAYYVPNGERGFTYPYQAYHSGARVAQPMGMELLSRSHHLELRWNEPALPDYNLTNRTDEALRLLGQLDDQEGQCRMIRDLDNDGKIDLKDIYYAVHIDELPDQYRPAPTPRPVRETPHNDEPNLSYTSGSPQQR
ncbi:MAG: hypothetical protein J0M34_04320 [Alphaproteobacteria bacterium]|nr:hypothetical protein [Alphaproteobacteria bacterium]